MTVSTAAFVVLAVVVVGALVVLLRYLHGLWRAARSALEAASDLEARVRAVRERLADAPIPPPGAESGSSTGPTPEANGDPRNRE